MYHSEPAVFKMVDIAMGMTVPGDETGPSLLNGNTGLPVLSQSVSLPEMKMRKIFVQHRGALSRI